MQTQRNVRFEHNASPSRWCYCGLKVGFDLWSSTLHTVSSSNSLTLTLIVYALQYSYIQWCRILHLFIYSKKGTINQMYYFYILHKYMSQVVSTQSYSSSIHISVSVIHASAIGRSLGWKYPVIKEFKSSNQKDELHFWRILQSYLWILNQDMYPVAKLLKSTMLF